MKRSAVKKTKKYGTSEEEITIEDNVAAREIVQEILRYGVTQAQILQIAYLLSLELESVAALKEISACIQRYQDSTNNSTSGIVTNI